MVYLTGAATVGMAITVNEMTMGIDRQIKAYEVECPVWLFMSLP
jgi:hypothetical protein